MLSIWERNSFTAYDHIILGGGIVGLSTAYYLKNKFPNQSVLILERGILPSGASTKNAGFACMGSPTELLDDLTHSTEEEVLELFLLRKKGLERMRSTLGDKNIEYQSNGSHELLFEYELKVLEKLEYLNQFLFKELQMNAFKIANEKIDQFQFNKQTVKAMIENLCEGEIDTGKMMRTLIEFATQLGVEIKTGCELSLFNDADTHVELHCKNPVTNTDIVFKAQALYICNNAFASQLLPEYDIVPGRGQVLITKPIANLPFKGIFHFDKGYYYFREYHGCVLLGGGRNLDFEKEKTTLLGLNDQIQQNLVDKMKEIILPNHLFEIDLQWSGIMAFGKSKRPIIKQHSERIFIGVRMGGMGIAIGTEVGYQLANILR